MGYARAGFDVTGVDLKPQPRYPFPFVQADALDYVGAHGHNYDVIHASPHCQFATAYRRKGHGVGDSYTNDIPAFRNALETIGGLWIIENVEYAAGELRAPAKLCGSAFGLDVQRHRLFETTFPLESTVCDHSIWTPRFPPASNRTNLRKTVEVGVRRIRLDVQQQAMGIDWMRREELSLALPPAYTHYVGRAALAALGEECAA